MRPASVSTAKATFLLPAGFDNTYHSLTGHWLMTRKVDGTVVVFDIETNGVARKLRGHTRQIQSLRCRRIDAQCYDAN